jgi:hypothetical protein
MVQESLTEYCRTPKESFSDFEDEDDEDCEWDEPLMDFDEWKAEYRARRNERILNGETIEETDNHWDPNVPFTGTQDEWFEHFLKIEEGEFVTLEEHEREFAEWKKEYLASLPY